jgi:hypothetical protein
MKIYLADGTVASWTQGSHYGKILSNAQGTQELDLFSFAWEKNEPTQLDFTNALTQYLGYMED